VDLSFNPTILTPVFETPKGIVENSQRIITLELPVNPDTKGVLKTVYLQTNLGTDTLSSLKLINQKSIGDSIGVKVIDGLLLLKGVCMEGGAPRLVNTSGSIQLELLKPNPSDNQIQINYETIESGLISLYIIDSFGKTVRIIKEGSEETGVKSMSYFIGDLASGIYYLKLKTPTSFKTQKFEVYK